MHAGQDERMCVRVASECPSAITWMQLDRNGKLLWTFAIWFYLKTQILHRTSIGHSIKTAIHIKVTKMNL